MSLVVILSSSNGKSYETDVNSFIYQIFPLQKYDSVWLGVCVVRIRASLERVLKISKCTFDENCYVKLT